MYIDLYWLQAAWQYLTSSYLTKTFVIETLYNYNLLCYVKCSKSLVPFKTVAMTHYHIMFTLLVTSHVASHLQGYRDPLNVRMHELPISVDDAKVLFAEIREIRDFNRYVRSCT